MYFWVYEISSGQFLRGGPCEQHASAGDAVVALKRNPKPRVERYDGAGEIRPATAREISDYDAARLAEHAADRFEEEKLVKALAIWTAQKLNIPLATARQEILAIRRSL